MKTIFVFLLSIACVSIESHAQTAKDVPDVAKHEVARRGNHVEETGSVQSASSVAAALAPPADDSDKWFLTLVIKPGDIESDKMRDVIARSPEMQAWVNVDNPKTSQTHYHVRSIDDKTQSDWFAGISPAIDRGGLPMVIVQPPRNGRYGKPEHIVKAISGVLSGKDLSAKLRLGIEDYIQTINAPVGVAQTKEVTSAAAVPNPFAGPRPNAPAPPNTLPFEFPPSKPTSLTIEQITEACPGATPDFILSVIKSQETDLRIVANRWEMHQMRDLLNQRANADQVCPVPDPSLNPQKPAPLLSWEPLAVVAVTAFVLGLVALWGLTKLAALLDIARTAKMNAMQARSSAPDPGPMYTSSPAYSPALTAALKPTPVTVPAPLNAKSG